jgi:hypothetical protein
MQELIQTKDLKLTVSVPRLVFLFALRTQEKAQSGFKSSLARRNTPRSANNIRFAYLCVGNLNLTDSVQVSHPPPADMGEPFQILSRVVRRHDAPSTSFHSVRGRGFEPPHLTAYPPQGYASTSFATRAFRQYYSKSLGFSTKKGLSPFLF